MGGSVTETRKEKYNRELEKERTRVNLGGIDWLMSHHLVYFKNVFLGIGAIFRNKKMMRAYDESDWLIKIDELIWLAELFG